MSKKLIVLSVIVLFTSVANAGDVNLKGLSVSAGTNAFKDAMGESGTGFDVGISYKYKVSDKWFLEPELKYGTGNDKPSNDKFLYTNIDIGYKFNLQNGYTLSPRLGYTFYKAMYIDGSNTGNGANIGMELGITKNLAIETTYTYFKGQTRGHWGSLTAVNLKYNF